MFYQIFLSPQLKRGAIVSNKHGVSQLPHELSNDLNHRSYKIRESQENLKTCWIIDQGPVFLLKCNFFQPQPKTPEKQKLNISPRMLFHMKTRVCLKYFVNNCLWKQRFASKLTQTPLNVISFTILVTLRPLTQF